MARSESQLVSVPAGPVRALWVIVALNVAVFLLWHLAPLAGGVGDRFMQRQFLVSSQTIAHGRVWTLLTSEFSHESLLHLAFNMLTLVSLGIDVERVLGSRAFTHLYVMGAMIASAAYVVYDWATPGSVPALGASGAVMAVVVAGAYLFPGRRVLLFFLIPMRQLFAVGVFLTVDLLGMFSSGADHIAHAAHLGGALYGWWYQHGVMRRYLEERLTRIRPAWPRLPR